MGDHHLQIDTDRYHLKWLRQKLKKYKEKLKQFWEKNAILKGALKHFNWLGPERAGFS